MARPVPTSGFIAQALETRILQTSRRGFIGSRHSAVPISYVCIGGGWKAPVRRGAQIQRPIILIAALLMVSVLAPAVGARQPEEDDHLEGPDPSGESPKPADRKQEFRVGAAF